jgi:LacI family transcriptional regulator
VRKRLRIIIIARCRPTVKGFSKKTRKKFEKALHLWKKFDTIIETEGVMKEKRVTIYDIAEAAGVSTGTVNRALSGKERISPKTKDKVLQTAKQLGYTANAAAQGLRRTPITIGAVLFCPIDEYVDDIIEGIEASARELEKYRVSVDVHKLPFTTAADCVSQTKALLRAFAEQQYGGAVLFLSAMTDDLDGMDELIAQLREQNFYVATVANDLPHTERVLHVGVDAHMAGSMAAELLEMSCAGGEVALMVASKNSVVNMDYIRGFEDYAGRGMFSSVSIYEHFDDKATVEQITDRMLAEHPSLSGVYMATASSVIACEYVKERGNRDMTVITTDLLAETPELLRQKIANAVIFQNPFKQGKNVVRMLYNHLIRQPNADVKLLAPRVLLSSNLQAYLFDKPEAEEGEDDHA